MAIHVSTWFHKQGTPSMLNQQHKPYPSITNRTSLCFPVIQRFSRASSLTRLDNNPWPLFRAKPKTSILPQRMSQDFSPSPQARIISWQEAVPRTRPFSPLCPLALPPCWGFLLLSACPRSTWLLRETAAAVGRKVDLDLKQTQRSQLCRGRILKVRPGDVGYRESGPVAGLG